MTTPKVLTEADAAAALAGLPRPVSSEDAQDLGRLTEYARKLLREQPPFAKEDINDRWEIAAAGLIRLFVSERDALAGRVAELEAEQVVVRGVTVGGLTINAGTPILALAERIRDLMAENADLRETPPAIQRANAERYCWLRDYHIGDDPDAINLKKAKRRGLDAAIDAALSTTPESKP